MLLSMLPLLCLGIVPLYVLAGESGQTEPSAFYLQDDVQFFPAPPELRPAPQPRPVIVATPLPVAPAALPPSHAARAPRAAAAQPPDVVHSLRDIAARLEHAGLDSEADQARDLAVQVAARATRQLELKAIEAARLQQQIGMLRAVAGQELTYCVRLQVLEVDDEALARLTAAAGEDDGLPVIVPVSLQPDALGWRPCDTACVEEMIEELRAEDRIKIIAQPSVVTGNDRPATVHSGCAFPVPLPAGGTELRETGFRLDVRPQLQDSGRVLLHLAAEVSERDEENAVEVQGVRVPGITTRRFSSTIETSPGSSMMFTGLPAVKPAADGPSTTNLALIVTLDQTSAVVVD